MTTEQADTIIRQLAGVIVLLSAIIVLGAAVVADVVFARGRARAMRDAYAPRRRRGDDGPWTHDGTDSEIRSGAGPVALYPGASGPMTFYSGASDQQGGLRPAPDRPLPPTPISD